MEAEIQAIMEAPVEIIQNRATEFVHQTDCRFAGESGELRDFFDPLLKVVNGLNFDALDFTTKIYAAAALLYEISLLKGATSKNPDPHLLGWDALNKDVKNWCRRMLQMPVPRDAGHEHKATAFAAKGLLAHLLAEAVPQTLRDVLTVEPALVLDAAVDE